MKAGSKYDDEKVLVADLKAGSEEAFTFLVDRHHLRVLRICKGFLRSDADADDIAQEVFVEVYRSIEKFRGNSSLSTWLYRIAVNKSLNALRAESRRKTISISREANDSDGASFVPIVEAGAESEADRDVYRMEQTRALDRALAMLPENQRTAFVLHRYDELPYREVAEVMDITIGSVESLIFRARQNLQKSLYSWYRENIDGSLPDGRDSSSKG